FMEALDSAWDFFKPWPGPETRRKIKGTGDLARFYVVWASTRLAFLERLTGTEQGWIMFCPDVSTEHLMPRARLFYADGEQATIKGPAEPESLTNFGPRFDYMRLRIGQAAERGSKSCFGYCNLLRHRYPKNEAGSPLVRIRLYQATIRFPPPGVD